MGETRINLSANQKKALRSGGVFQAAVRMDRVVLLEPSGTKHVVALDHEMVKIPGVGVVRADTLRTSIGRRKTIGSRSFLVLTPTIRDDLEGLRRRAQTIGPKDVPALLWNCNLEAGDFAVEVGAGSGSLTIALAQAVGADGRVVTYDLRRDFLDIARRNVASAGFEGRVAFKVGDARKELPEQDADALFLDIPDPWEAVKTSANALRPCGTFASFSPNAEQVNQTVKALRTNTFVEIRTVEIIEREIVSQESGTRPSFAPLGHTGYLTFARKVLDTF